MHWAMGRRRALASLLVALATGALLFPAAVRAAPSNWLAVDGNIRFNPVGGGTHDWANSGAALPVNGCPAGAVSISGTGGLFNCGHANPAPAPPTGPSLTPAALADPSLISSLFIVDPLNSDQTACGVGDPTTFGGAAKNGDAIASYTYGTGAVLNKDKLGNVYAVAHSTLGRPELFFAAERLVNNGDSHMDFEFMQSQVGLTGACAGSFTGNRTEGDLLAAVDFTNGGVLATSSLYQWHCAAEPGPQPPDGTVCDPPGAPHYQQIAIPGSITFTVNSATIPCGGWVCRDAVTGNATQVAANDFMEGGIDLTVLNFAGCFTTFLPHTRTAQSFTSVVKDFAGPSSLPTCRPPTIATAATPAGGNLVPGISATDTVVVGPAAGGPAPTGTVTFFLCTPAQVNGSGCSGGSQVGAVKPLVGGAAQSDPTANTGALGTYCWRTVYTPGAGSQGIYATTTHTNSGSECFSVGVPAPPLAGHSLEPSISTISLAEAGPLRLRIPALAVEAPVERVGVGPDGTMGVPVALGDVGWLDTGPAPGQVGTAVIAGHRDSATGAPAVFWNLERLEAGNRIYVVGAEGDDLVFIITEVRAYPVRAFPAFRVFAGTDGRVLNLITCAGSFVRGMYDQRLVVYSRLLPLRHQRTRQ
jgi:sortase (surface protein transpeptidase)